jgi:hypothetical protein
MEPTLIARTRVIAVEGRRLDNGRTEYGTSIKGLNERVAEALQQCTGDGYTELVDAQYAVAFDAEGDDRTFSALLVVRKPDYAGHPARGSSWGLRCVGRNARAGTGTRGAHGRLRVIGKSRIGTKIGTM